MTGIVAQNVGRTSGLIKAVSGGGAWTLIKTLTSDGSDADLSFVDGADDVVLDSTYPIYVFKFIDIHPETDQVDFDFNFSIDSGSNYNVAKTTTFFNAQHFENDGTGLGYEAANDLAQGTGGQPLVYAVGNGNDESSSGSMYLFNPSSTTFVKTYISDFNEHYRTGLPGSVRCFSAGHGNTTSAVDAVQFKMSADEIQGGKIKLYGLSDS